MSRSVSVCLCAVVAFMAFAGLRLLTPSHVLAASGTVSMETPLHESPAHSAPLIALLPEGTVVSIDGPPTDGFYPVSTGGLTGWMRGETLVLEKDIVDESATAEAAEPAPPLDAAPIEQIAADGAVPAESPAPADATVDPAVATDPALAADPALTADPAPQPSAPEQLTEPAADPASISPDGPADTSTDAAAAPIDAAAAPVAAPPSDASSETAPAATPIASVEGGEPSGGETVEPAVTPIPQPEMSPTGPASVTVDAPIRSGPAASFDLIFSVPRGSTIEQTGHVVDGYVTVQYKEVTGWLALEHLGQASDFVAEPVPEAAAEPVDTKTPRAGSGVAYATVDLSMRAGPSANDEPVAAVPAGARVVLTGVMEGGFQRVTYRDQIGWVANDFLETPAEPEPAANSEQSYARKEIVRIIYAAADRFDQSRSDMLRVAECESNLDPLAVNPSGSYGLFQFIRSTWKSTPYGEQDIFNPRANAEAAAWMWSEGRKSEWVCQ